MRNRRNGLLLFCLALCVSAVTVVAALDSRPVSQDTKPKPTPAQAEEVDTTKFPVVDYYDIPATTAEQEKRDKIGKKFNSRHGTPIPEETDRVFYSYDWDVGLSALPIAKSSSVIIGNVTDARAYLSQDRSRVYSEFNVRIETVFKNDTSISLREGDAVPVERLGGRLRFPSGKIVTFWVNHQDLPKPGRRYLLFLTQWSLLGGLYEDSLFVLTGYELREGKVFPLDKTSPGHSITKYKGANETTLLENLASVLATP